MAEGKDRHITLRYCLAPHGYEPEALRLGTWSPEWYLTMLCFPLREMLGSTPVELAVEMVQYTRSADWVAASKRQMARGDMLYINQECWAYINTTDAPAFTAANMMVLSLPAMAETSIVRLMETADVAAVVT